MLKLKKIGVELIAIRRGDKKFFRLLHNNIKLQTDDIVVVYGAPDDIEQAEKKLMQG